MKNTMILDPLSDVERENIKEISQNLKKIEELMKIYFDEVRYDSFNDALKYLNISEEEYILAYMTNYVTKIDSGLNKLLREDELDIQNGNLSLRDKLRKIGNVFINSNVLSAQEEVYHCLSMPLTRCSSGEIYINTIPIDQRVRMLKSKSDLEKLNDDSNDIFYSNIFEKYSKRDISLETICLAEFAASQNVRSKSKEYNNKETYENSSDDNGTDNDDMQETTATKQKKLKIKINKI